MEGGVWGGGGTRFGNHLIHSFLRRRAERKTETAKAQPLLFPLSFLSCCWRGVREARKGASWHRVTRRYTAQDRAYVTAAAYPNFTGREHEQWAMQGPEQAGEEEKGEEGMAIVVPLVECVRGGRGKKTKVVHTP